MRFIVVCDRRTGSNWLAAMLGSSPGVAMFGELFDMEHLDAAALGDPRDYLQRRLATATATGARAVGFKLIYDQASAWQAHLDDSLPGVGAGVRARIREFADRVAAAGGAEVVAARLYTVRQMLRDDSALRVVHLRRRNLLRQYVSLRRAMAGDAWGGGGAGAALELTETECREAFERSAALAASCDAEFAHHPLHRLWYEDLCADPARELGAVLAFLGLDPKCAPRIAPSAAPPPLQNLVGNLDTLRAAFRGSAWSEHLE